MVSKYTRGTPGWGVGVKLTWFSSGKTTSLLGTPRDCSTLNAASPSEMGSL